MNHGFAYWTAFARNIGWVTVAEQAVLRRRRVAIGGLGGVGGSHLLTLARLGIGAFHIADFDVFDLANFNRQVGASLASLGRPKVEVLAEMAGAINPELSLVKFPDGVTADNLGRFLDGVDVYVDGLDFFAHTARRAVFAACRERGIPAVTVAPLGMGAALLVFLPEGMSFDEYFGLAGCPEEEQSLRFLVGLAPGRLHQRYLVEPGRIDLRHRRGPSTAMACELCAGIAASEVLKLLLRRGKVWPAPHGFQFDAFGNRLAHTWRPGGHRNPWQRRALAEARRQFLGLKERAGSAPETPMAQVLDLARWAPSGDNAQPWRFQLLDERRCVVHGRPGVQDGVYDLDGRSGLLALGALLENITIAAREFGFRAECRRRPDSPETAPRLDVELLPDPGAPLSPLFPCLTLRTTQRRPLSRTPLSPEHKRRLEEAAGPGYGIVWLERERLRVANLLFRNAKIRFTIPEAFPVHRAVIQWHSRFSEDRIPDQAIGLDPLTTALMRWTLGSWGRARFVGTYLGGTVLPRLQLDWLPGLFCAAHFALLAEAMPRTADDYLGAGRALQRVWLTATLLGLQVQPEMTPLIFARYVREGRRFTELESALRTAERVAAEWAALIGPEQAPRAVFFARIGHGPRPVARSLRLPLVKLRWEESSGWGGSGLPVSPGPGGSAAGSGPARGRPG
ncbi:ThiF family adenylyltransferase [Candidatus Methylocalor cossyra]|uniref:Thiamine biosynthesis protein ThiF n=1 Tax=Candidatus Methylocalor cossyra TaxID=3108543 RepID=A0ABP1CDL1_9GAMM